LQSISPGLVRTEIAIAAGASDAASNNMFDNVNNLDPQDVADALLYALGTPAHVQVKF
jgi:NADP-dependent 3-hydroxy acid dehydrogenase YdfG